jgi:hypothetical protein
VIACLSLWLLRRAHGEDPVTVAWRRFCRKLAHRGTARRPSEGPRAFSQRAAAEQPHVAANVNEIGELYVRVRYGRDPDPSLAGLLRQRVRELRV